MDSDSPLERQYVPLTAEPDVWLRLNAFGLVVCMAWLGTRPSLSISTLAWGPLILTAGVWGACQWWVLRRPLLQVGVWWIGATAVGWLLALPFTTAAVELIPRTYADLIGMAAGMHFTVPPPLDVIAGYFVVASLLGFFGIFGGMALALPQMVGLWLRPRTRPLAGVWFGAACWGWIVGVFTGGLLISFVMALVALVAERAPAEWVTMAAVGGTAALVYGFYTAKLPLKPGEGERIDMSEMGK